MKKLVGVALALGCLLSAQEARAENVDINLTVNPDSAVVAGTSSDSSVTFSCNPIDDFSFVGDSETIFRVNFDAGDGLYVVRTATSASISARFSPTGTTCPSFAMGNSNQLLTATIEGSNVPSTTFTGGTIQTNSHLGFSVSLDRRGGYVFDGYTLAQDNLTTSGNSSIMGAQTYKLCECTVKFSSSVLFATQPVATYAYPTPPPVAVYESYSGEACGEANGIVLRYGPDDGGAGAGDFTLSTFWDGILQDDEQDSAFTFCDAEAGATGSAGSLFATTAEPAGENCEFGGLKVTSGVDDDGSETLDEGEVDNTGYVCNGEDGTPGADGEDGSPGNDGTPGTPGTSGPMGEPGADGRTSLVSVTPEATGANCTAGGIKVATGVDDDDNGTLEEGEIDETSYVCSATTAAVSGGGGCAVGSSDTSSWSLLVLLAMVGLAIRRKR